MGKIKRVFVNSIDWFLYRVISDERRKKLSGIVSTETKEKIKGVLHYGAQREKQLRLKRLKNHLYTLGFEEQALADLKTMLITEKKQYMKRMIAWEIALWYANKYTVENAKKAIDYVAIARDGERNKQQLRQIAIIEAESYFYVNKPVKSLSILQEALEMEEHPDLYLAMANLEVNPTVKIAFLNKALAQFHLSPVKFEKADEPTYNHLKIADKKAKIQHEDKVSVIIPAYNAEDGIHVAIESILDQTWTNVELIVVDDCSTDATIQVAEKYAEADERVKVYSTPTNSGPYIARNIGLQHATGKYITINDADDWSHEEKLEKQVIHLQKNPHIIANTSGHARITEEDLQFYRRGTPGKFIFPNMSSIMFRKDEVMEKLGYWNCVRFAADGEFKRRLIKVFGVNRYVDLQSGPLSLPRQAVASLTSSSAFGYNGFFMGARKEYVESFTYSHLQHENLYYPYPVEGNIFPVPRPMWPNKVKGICHFDEIVMADFRLLYGEDDPLWLELKSKLQKNNKQIGLVQTYTYDIEKEIQIHQTVRKLINGDNIQMVVYGEEVETEQLTVIDEETITLKQKYIPNIICEKLSVVIRCGIVKQVVQKLEEKYNVSATIIPINEQVRNNVDEHVYTIAKEDWVSKRE